MSQALPKHLGYVGRTRKMQTVSGCLELTSGGRLSGVPITVINTMIRANLGREEFVSSYTSIPQSSIEGIQGITQARRTWRLEFKQRP